MQVIKIVNKISNSIQKPGLNNRTHEDCQYYVHLDSNSQGGSVQ